MALCERALARAKARTSRGEILDRLRKATTRIKLFLLTNWYSHRRKALWIVGATTALVAGLLLACYWSSLDNYLSGLEKSVVPELAIGTGAAITGIIAIAFSLSLFAIQQVADRGTPATLQAYARDRVIVIIYWTLAAFAIICFAIALLKVERNYHTGAAVADLLLLFGSFVLLNIHFRRVIKFADPRFTIRRIFEQGEKQLRALQDLSDNVGQHMPRDPRTRK